MRKYEENERIRIIENFTELSNTLHSKVQEESKNLSELYSKQEKANKELSRIEGQVKSELEHLTSMRLECAKEQQNINKQKVDIKRRESEINKFNDDFKKRVISQEESIKKLEERNEQLLDEVELVDKQKQKKVSGMKLEIISCSNQIQDSTIQLETIRKNVDLLDKEFDKSSREKELSIEKLDKKYKILKSEYDKISDELDIKKSAFNEIKASYRKEELNIEKKRKEFSTLARRIEVLYQEKLPGFKINII